MAEILLSLFVNWVHLGSWSTISWKFAVDIGSGIVLKLGVRDPSNGPGVKV